MTDVAVNVGAYGTRIRVRDDVAEYLGVDVAVYVGVFVGVIVGMC